MTAEALAWRLGCFEALGYFVPPLTAEQRRVRLLKFRDAVAELPAPFTAGAFEDWFRTMSRAPTPGDIANMARRALGDARRRLRLAAPSAVPVRTREAKERKRVERRAAVERLERERPELFWFRRPGDGEGV